MCVEEMRSTIESTAQNICIRYSVDLSICGLIGNLAVVCSCYISIRRMVVLMSYFVSEFCLRRLTIRAA